MQRKLKALEEYCDNNGLAVDASKTKFIVFQKGGRPKSSVQRYTTYKGERLEIVSKYTYLGIPMCSSALGLAAVNAAITKTKIASGTTIAILARARCDSWNAYSKLFDRLALSTALYAFPTWGLRYLDRLEKIQTDFYKRLLYLPRGTPNWALRTKLGLSNLAVGAMRLTWRWHTKILSMDRASPARTCMNRLPPCPNWLSKHRIQLDTPIQGFSRRSRGG